MDITLLNLRRKFEVFARESLKANWHGAGTDLLTGEVEFSFDLDDRTYSVHINELTQKLKGDLNEKVS